MSNASEDLKDLDGSASEDCLGELLDENVSDEDTSVNGNGYEGIGGDEEEDEAIKSELKRGLYGQKKSKDKTSRKRRRVSLEDDDDEDYKVSVDDDEDCLEDEEDSIVTKRNRVLGSLGSSCSQDDTSSDQRTDIDLIDGLDLNVAPSPPPFTRGVGSLASPRSNGTVNQGASLLAGAGAIHHMLSGHRSNAMASRTDGISAAHMSPSPLVPIIVRQGECLDLHEKHKQTKIIYKIKGLHGDEESDTDIPEAQGCVEDRESPLESSSASTSGRSGLFIEMVSSSLLHPNQSYAPLGTEDPGSSGSEVELLRFDVSYSIQHAQVKMVELAKTHAKASMPSFGDGKEGQPLIGEPFQRNN
ncbi:hypothetical protein SAY86_027716 [Trapa natans]|uniref:Uncharacterized protein n=1 Tax=Trapa natans TaxID=22666 RepID=A0AAN7KUG9_TRANT|nr:hypothetical protein SAY86_027716 [Trapa natans]